MTEAVSRVSLYGLRCTMDDAYRGCLRRAWLILLGVAALCVLAAYHARDFTFDASSETLIERDNEELAYYEEFAARFDQAPTLFMTYMPRRDVLFSEHHLGRIAELQRQLESLAGVRSVTSLLDVPLLESPPVPLTSMAEDYRTLRDPGTDLTLARKELTSSPMFRELLVSADGRATALAIELDEPEALAEARDARDRARRDFRDGRIPADRLEAAEQSYGRIYEHHKLRRSEVVAAVRDVRDGLSGEATLHLGGVPMVAVDMIHFVRQDVAVFGLVVLVLIAVSLYAFFRRLRWVLIPIGTTAVTLLLVVGLLGYLQQPVTVISANFMPLIAIVTISFTIHLISRYRELRHQRFSSSHRALVAEAMVSKFMPCLYTALTTVVAFGSLLTSDIVPVVDFGWIMCVGVVISLLVTYSFFASVLMLLPMGRAASTLGRKWALTAWLQDLALHRRGLLLMAALASVAGSVAGIAQLELGNRFTEYFRSGTEIRDGMVFIDENLGGTIPLDVVLRFPPYEPVTASPEDGFDDFSMEGVEEVYPERYWFTPEKIDVVRQMHEYLAGRPEIGKVLSVASLETIARGFNDGEPLSYLELTAALGLVPDEVRINLVEPYAAPASGEMRISARLHETGPDYSREELIQDIRQFGEETLGTRVQQVQVTGMAVLFNDMLLQLLLSQTSTLVFVVLVTLGMFAVLFRSFTLALIGVLPNALAALTILGVMGMFGIPLDMMTITIAAIVIGVGVDDAVHYLHRYRDELARTGSVVEAIRASHASIGHAMYYTSITVVIGFSVLAISNFLPTVYFGALTALAMMLALFANLTLLPALLQVASRNFRR